MYCCSLTLYNKLLLRMAELYSKNTSNSEQLKPSKKTIRFLIDYSKSLKSANKHVENASNPDLVSKLIYKIINTKNPKIHYKVGQFIQKFSIVLKNILSDRLYEKILLYYSKN